MCCSKQIIIELAEFLKGERSDTNGYYASFFQKKVKGIFEGVQTSLIESHIENHHMVMMEKLLKKKKDVIDPWKRRCYDFENGIEVVEKAMYPKSFR